MIKMTKSDTSINESLSDVTLSSVKLCSPGHY